MKQYEYIIHHETDIRLDVKLAELNHLGAKGWTVVDVEHGNDWTRYTLMREITKETPARFL